MEKLNLSDPKITDIRVIDLRFPTSLQQIGSDAVNKDPDYSAAYCILETDARVQGHALTSTLGMGTELCVSAIRCLGRVARGRRLSSLTDDMSALLTELTGDS